VLIWIVMQLLLTVNSDALNLELFYQIVACLFTFLDGWVVGSFPVM